jgi:hypothetical protein
VALRGAALLAVPREVTCFHRVMSFQFAAESARQPYQEP